MSQHICLRLRTAPVTTVPADPLDCPLCRAALLDAFRAPVDAPESAPEPVGGPFARLGRRSLSVPPPEASSGCLEPELCTPDDPCPVCEPEPDIHHDVRVNVRESPSAPGRGFWAAYCTCGWKKSGLWGNDKVPGLGAARDLAMRWMRAHREETDFEENGS